jgi:hypothetical protein
MTLRFKVYWQSWPTLHKKRLLEILAEIDSAISDTDAYEADLRSSILEGGFGLDDFMQENESFFGSLEGVFDVAMMLETQALERKTSFFQLQMKKRPISVPWVI